MTTSFVQKGVELIKHAVEKDNAEEYEEALSFYAQGIQYLLTALKYERNQKVQSSINEKIEKFLKRAEDIKSTHCIVRRRPSFPSSKMDKIKKKKKKKRLFYPNQEDINEAIEDANKETMDIINSYIHQIEKSLNINYYIPTEIINLCLVYYHIATTFVAFNTTIVMEKPQVKWDDIAGLESQKQQLKTAVILPIKFPQLFVNRTLPHTLLYGPSGVGKSYLAKAVGSEANNASFFHISVSDLFCKCTGDSEKVIKNMFNMAIEKKPSIIVFDEIDSFHARRGSMEYSCKIKTEFLMGMDNKVEHGICIIGITNCPWDLDPVITKRFQKRIYISLPDEEARKKLFKIHIGKDANNLCEQDYVTLAEMTEGFSGSDIRCIVQDALTEPVRNLKNATHFKRVTGDVNNSNDYELVVCGASDDGAIKMSLLEIPDDEQDKVKMEPLEIRHFLKILQSAGTTVSQQDVQRYIHWKDEFGEGE